MLANGAKLYYKTTQAGTYTELTGLKELPDMGVEPEKVENTCLSDTVMQYENGIGDAGDMTYTFKYDNSSSTSSYRVLRGIETNKTVAYFKEVLQDGTITEFQAEVAIKRTGAGVNGALEFQVAMSLHSGITITDPSGTFAVDNTTLTIAQSGTALAHTYNGTLPITCTVSGTGVSAHISGNTVIFEATASATAGERTATYTDSASNTCTTTITVTA